ncbi:hypothetical protein [Cyanobium gracile]|uniref:PIN domain-containing protein n=1 Tax=Cyanobium gracile UHCC 0281 TaxID=3110309 RepID=A0ABU5SYY1_9CYAN|nr:hypothetical protein [Cyanobium gracile]MEA5443613.1 hypothetical protein [Cyanobium gracile UHCC 0281]
MIVLDTNICITIINAKPPAVLERFKHYRLGENPRWRRHEPPDAQRCAQTAAAGPPKQSKCSEFRLSERLK